MSFFILGPFVNVLYDLIVVLVFSLLSFAYFHI